MEEILKTTDFPWRDRSMDTEDTGKLGPQLVDTKLAAKVSDVLDTDEWTQIHALDE